MTLYTAPVLNPGRTPESFVIYEDGAAIKSLNCKTGSITSGIASTLIQGAINGLTAGRTWKERIVLRGNFTLAAGLSLPAYSILDLRKAKLTLADNVNTDMITATGSYFEIIGGMLNGNRSAQVSGSGIRVSGPATRFFIGDGMYITNTRQHGIYMLGGAGNVIQVGEVYDVDIEGCLGNGILTSNFTSDNIYSRLNLGGNDGNGIGINGSDGNLVVDSLIWNNAEGIDIFFSQDNTIVGNRVDSNASFGIKIDATSGTNTVTGNRLFSNVTAQIQDAGTTNIIRNNSGYVTENTATATIAAGGTSVTVNHGCDFTPAAKDVQLTLTNLPTNDIGEIYVDTFTATQMTVHCRNAPGAATAIIQCTVRKV